MLPYADGLTKSKYSFSISFFCSGAKTTSFVLAIAYAVLFVSICTVKMFPSHANFFLARVTDAVKIYNYLVGKGIIVRNRNSVSLCGNCLRVTVGTRGENEKLIEALKEYM